VATAATLDELLAPLKADPRHSAVLLDVDGVLAPIVRHADDAHVPEPTRVPLIAVAKRYGLVACVSGRRATTARRIVSLGSITYVGNHGAEVLRGGRTEVELDPEVASWSPRMEAWADEAWNEELHRLRVRAEDKDVIRAYHWRGAPDETAAEDAVRKIAERAEKDGFVVHWGRKVLEVRPPVELNKGRGVEHLLAALRRLAGDGRLQAAACVGVASDETPPELEAQSDVLVDGPVGVRALLSALVA
jgi:trehalose 6-phosphate phosphatase